MKNSSISKILCGAVFSIASVVSMAASAGGYSETIVTTTAEGLRTTTVSYADLNMSDPKDKGILERRVRLAAQKVCGSSDWRTAGSVRQASANKSCSQAAVAGAVDMSASSQVALVSR